MSGLPNSARAFFKQSKDSVGFQPVSLSQIVLGCPSIRTQRRTRCGAVLKSARDGFRRWSSDSHTVREDVKIRIEDEELPPEGIAVKVEEFDKEGVVYEKRGAHNVKIRTPIARSLL
jgi:hypothetical protein